MTTAPPTGWHRASDGNWYYGLDPKPYRHPPQEDGRGGWHAAVPVAVAARRTNAFAVTSLVLGVLWIFGLGSLAALVFGILALRQIRRTGDEGRGLAIVGVVLGAIGTALLAVILVVYVLGAVTNAVYQDTCDEIIVENSTTGECVTEGLAGAQPATYGVVPSRGGWEAPDPTQPGVVSFTPHRRIGLCDEHKRTPVGVCDCVYGYGYVGDTCLVCGQARVYLVTRPKTPG